VDKCGFTQAVRFQAIFSPEVEFFFHNPTAAEIGSDFSPGEIVPFQAHSESVVLPISLLLQLSLIGAFKERVPLYQSR